MDSGGGNPDCLYHYVRLHSDYTYRVFGKRGSTALFNLEVTSGDIAECATAKRNNGDFYVLGTPNADIEIFIGGEKRNGNWIGLEPGHSFAQIRQLFNDWENETPATLHIERIGAEYPPPPITPDGVFDYIRRYNDCLIKLGRIDHSVVRQFYTAEPLKFQGNHTVGWTQFAYGKTHWRCASDEAILMEAMPPAESPYWSIQLCNHFWQTMDFYFRQTSINGHQAVLDNDGRFRMVIAHRDPGVPNWLDPAGHTFGLLYMRCFGQMPEAKFRVVPFNKLHDALPSETKRISRIERSEALRKRRFTLERRLLD
jgi:hypothetical protein